MGLVNAKHAITVHMYSFFLLFPGNYKHMHASGIRGHVLLGVLESHTFSRKFRILITLVEIQRVTTWNRHMVWTFFFLDGDRKTLWNTLDFLPCNEHPLGFFDGRRNCQQLLLRTVDVSWSWWASHLVCDWHRWFMDFPTGVIGFIWIHLVRLQQLDHDNSVFRWLVLRGTDPRNTFPECVEKGSRFTLGSGGGEVFAQRYFCVRNCLQPPWGRYGRASGEYCKSGRFWRFQTSVTLFRVAGVALRDIPTCFTKCRQSFCVTGAILLHRFQKTSWFFGRQAQHFGRVHFHFAWQVQHFRRVVLRVFCESHCQGCVKWWQRANCVAGMGDCEGVFLGGRHSIWWYAQYLGHNTLTLYALHFTLDTPHSTMYTHTLHFTLHTLHSPFYTYTLHATLFTLHFTLHISHSTLYTAHSILDTPHSIFTLYTQHLTLHALHSTLYTLHCTRYTPDSTL